MSEPQQAFPHDLRLATKTARAGVIALNDVVYEDQYSIVTRSDTGGPVTAVNATYALSADKTSLEEISRLAYTEEDGVAAATLMLLSGNGQMETVFGMTPEATHIRSVDQDGAATATFTKEGLTWDSLGAAIYLGGDHFRICYDAGDAESGSSLLIQALSSSGDYVTKWSVTRDP